MELADALQPDTDGRTLADETYTSRVFTDFTLRPPVGTSFTIRGVKFEDFRERDSGDAGLWGRVIYQRRGQVKNLKSFLHLG